MNDVKLGTWAEIPTPYVTHIMSKAGFDFSIADFEHGSMDIETVQNMIFASHAENKLLYVRVPEITEAWVLRVLDMGCDGIIFPQVNTIEQLEKIIEYSYYPKSGKRGYNPYITAGNYGDVSKNYFQEENNRIKIGIILENESIFNDLDKILEYNEIDIFYIGQYDLSVDMGIPGEVANPRLLKVMDEAVKKINKANKIAGCMVHSINEAKSVIQQGFSFIVYKVDTALLFNSVRDFVEGVK